jgi:MFS transporter, PHS family, inorganic phosphate transporter
MRFNGEKLSDPNSDGLGWVFIIYGFVMALAALFAWVWIPSLQDPRDASRRLRLPTKTLEVLGEGLVRARGGGEVIGMRAKIRETIIRPLMQMWEQRWRAQRVNG